MGTAMLLGRMVKELPGSGSISEMANKLAQPSMGSAEAKVRNTMGGYGATTGNANANTLNALTVANKQITGSTPTRGKNDGNALTHDVTAAEGGTTEANARSFDQIMEEIEQGHIKEAQERQARIKSFAQSSAAGISKTLGEINKNENDDEYELVGESDDLGLVTSSEDVIQTGETTDKVTEEVAEATDQVKADAQPGIIDDISKNLTDGLSDDELAASRYQQASSELGVSVPETPTANGREIFEPITEDSDVLDALSLGE